MNATDVQVIQRDTVYKGYARIDRYSLRHPLYEGGMGPALEREVMERGQVAAVLPVDTESQEVVLIEQFRPGAYVRGWHPWLLECVAGVLEENESAQDLCRREAIEEAGCTITNLKSILPSFLTSPGLTTESVALFWAQVDAREAQGIHGLAEEGENIRVLRFSFDDALALLANGRVVNAKTIIALQWLALNRHRLDSL